MQAHGIQIFRSRFGPAALLSVSLMACQSTSTSRGAPTTTSTEASPEALSDEPNPDTRTAAKPTAVPPPPAPEIVGAIVDQKGGLYVQVCGEQIPCPALLHGPATEACAAQALGKLKGWRLPTKNEMTRLKHLKGLEGAAGYHWTSTAYGEDASQFWIVGRDSSPSTTIPATRKPFTARCVRELP